MSRLLSMLTAAMLAIVASAGVAAPSAERPAVTASVRLIVEGGVPTVRYTSGTAVWDEALHDGRWVGRYFSASGQAVPYAASAAAAPGTDAFQLELENRILNRWRYVGFDQRRVSAPYAGLLATVELRSLDMPVLVRVKTMLLGGPVAVRWLEIVNVGDKATAITNISPWSGRLWDFRDYKNRVAADKSVFELGYTKSGESFFDVGSFAFEDLNNQRRVVTSDYQNTSGFKHPTFFAHNRATGDWFVASLAWSAGWRFVVSDRTDSAADDAQLDFRIGPYTTDGVLRVISAGETVTSPEVHLLHRFGEFDDVVQSLHDHVRGNVLLPPVKGREHQVEAGFIYAGDKDAFYKEQIDLTSGVGAELFMVDAGWYGNVRGDWFNSVGDWQVGSWLPDGLAGTRAYAHSKGMLFGLWAEIEGIGASSTLRTTHPEWVMRRDGIPAGGGRQAETYLADHDADVETERAYQPGGRMLDYSNPAAAKWIEDEIARMIQQYGVDMFRIDMNMQYQLAGNRMRAGFNESVMWRHVQALYGIMERIHARFPNVILQNCAAGGARLDLGILHRFHNTELSDWFKEQRGLQIVNGMTWILPPEALLRSFQPDFRPGSDGDIDQQLTVAEFARPIIRGLADSKEDLNPVLQRRVREVIADYKTRLRPIEVESRVYHHTPVTDRAAASPWLVLEYGSRDRRRAMVALARLSTIGDDTYLFRPRGLDAAGRYRMTFQRSGEHLDLTPEQLLEGIPIRIAEPLRTEVLIFEPLRQSAPAAVTNGRR